MKKILAVDDETANQDIIVRLLKNKYDITIAATGEEALEILKKESFDLILMDLNLGMGLTGIDVTQILRIDRQYRNIPIIALTAYAMPEDRERCLSAGFTDYLAMPFNKEDLYEIIRKNLEEDK